MDIRQLKYFVAIANCGSLSKASSKLHVVQSALSHNLSQLEDELGVKLFHRRPRGVELTKAGELLAKHAVTILDTIAQAKNEVATVSADLKENIWIGLNPTTNKMVMPALVRAVTEEFPSMKLGVVEDLSAIVLEYLTQEKVDIAVAYNPPQDDSLITIPMIREHVCCVGSPDFLGVSQDPIRFSEVLKLPLVLAGQGENLRGIVKEDKQFKELTRACKLEINSLPVLIDVIRDAFGCAILSARTAKEYVERGELNARLITDPIISRELHIVYPRDSAHTPLLNKLAGIIKTQILKALDPNDETIEPIYD